MSTAAVTEAVLAELDVPHNVKIINTSNKDNRTPEFLALNPNGKIPTIVHDGTPIWESAAITIYLGEAFGVEKNVWPKLGPERGQAMQWVVWTNVNMASELGRLNRQDSDQKTKDESKVNLKKLVDILNGALKGKEYLLGDQFTLADTHVNSFVTYTQMLGVDLTGLDDLQRHSKVCTERDQKNHEKK